MLLLSTLLLTSSIGHREPLTIVVHADQPAHAISKDLFGVFFEEINHAGDGGLNPELIRNFNFREPLVSGALPGWMPVENAAAGTLSLSRGGVVIDRKQPGSGALGITNDGFWGIPTVAGKRLLVSVTCSCTTATPIELRLVDESGAMIGATSVLPSADFSLVKSTITPSKSVPTAKLQVSVEKFGQVAIRSVSVQPTDTFRGHGLRGDLAGLVNGLRPAFVRFPGGCYVEGGDYLADRFKWESTLMPPAERLGHRNATWGYWSSDGLGYHEYLQWCEDMNASALFVVNCGFSHRETVSMDDLDPYLLSTFDAIDYAIGPTTSRYGALRARRGHPAPFPLKYLEIGNENGQGWTSGGSPADYAAHYTYFADKLKQRYPQLVLIADTRAAKNASLVDDHYYNSPDWFWRNTGIYDKADRNGPQVYVGEYAVTSNCGKGNLRAALAEAAFMTGLERNSDVVRMASYAPLFTNVNNRAWNPDAICFDGQASYGTPSYWVQQVFGANRGDAFLPTEYPELPQVDTFTGGVGVGTWQTSAEYKELTVTVDGKTLYAPDMSKPLSDWQPAGGMWSTTDGAYRQTSSDDNAFTLSTAPSLAGLTDYDLHVKARKLSGAEGFLILFHAQDAHRYLWWNIGGWGNQQTGVEATSGDGRYGIGRRIPFKVETGRWYDIRIEVRSDAMKLYADGKLVQSVTMSGAPTLAVSSSRVDQSGDVVVKVVNDANEARNANLTIAGLADGPRTAVVTTLTSDSMTDENSLSEPTKVAPKTAVIRLTGKQFDHVFPARSLTVLRIRRS